MEQAAGAAGFFVGKFRHSLDPKRRLTIPSGWREIVGAPRRVFVLPGIPKPCLTVFPARVMAPKLADIARVSMADVHKRNLLQVLGSRSEQLEWDTQGRIRVCDELLAHAHIRDQVILVGNFDGFTLWSPDLWQEVDAAMDLATMIEEAKKIGI